MENELIEKISGSISNIEQKKHKIYFFIQDTRGNAKASIAYQYEMAMTLKNGGFTVIMLHEKNDFIPVTSWLGEKYSELTHQSVEGTNLQIAPEDIIVVPEIYGYIMEQVKNLPCGKIVLCQAYDHILETLQPGVSWQQLGFLKCITTSNSIKEYLESVMRNVSFDILKPFISNEFNPSNLPSKPIIAIHSREQRDSINVIKTFYLKFPQYRWVTFRDMRGLSQKEFANGMKDSCLSVWIDESSSYGTFPLESMKCEVPVLGLVPNMVPEWMNENNGLWINNKVQIPDFIANYLQNWLEDNLNETLFEEMKKTSETQLSESDFEKQSVELFKHYIETRLTSFEEQINKLQPVE